MKKNNDSLLNLFKHYEVNSQNIKGGLQTVVGWTILDGKTSFDVENSDGSVDCGVGSYDDSSALHTDVLNAS